MMKRFLFLAFLLPLFVNAQVSQDVTVPLTATVSQSPVSVLIEWPNPTGGNLLLLRRTKGQSGTQWISLINATGSTLTSYNDQNVVAGQTYEYALRRTTTFDAFGYAHVAVHAPATDSRGKVMIVIDSTNASALAFELDRLKNDMIGDGWQVITRQIGSNATVTSIKSMIGTAYSLDPQGLKQVLLIGSVPVPYSGNTAWDGHGDHQGAWPADVYYGDLYGLWTDVTVNNITPSRPANQNVPGDGKFDQSYIPSIVELAVGRVDFRKIDAPAFGETDATGLIRRYLDKNHAWRTGAYEVEQRALVDDNFGYFGGEAFAANGYRNAYPVVGPANIVNTDFFNNTNPQTWLIGYGCGGGHYQGAGGVGSSSNFATDTINIVFSNLFGSYFGDWDHESNPFMVAALASRGGILTCSWAGRPHQFYQALASGETMGYCIRETHNAQYNNGFVNTFGRSGAHITLLGDPTLRVNVVAPPSGVQAERICGNVHVSWQPSVKGVDGYLVYRSLSADGPFIRISSQTVTDTVFTDFNPVEGTLYYQIRAVRNTANAGGGVYTNNSTGSTGSVVFTTPAPLEVSAAATVITCAVPEAAITSSASFDVSSWNWSGPGGFASSDPVALTTIPGTYVLTATDASGCTATTAVAVQIDTVATNGPILPGTAIICDGDCLNLVTAGIYTVSPSEICDPGTYIITVTNSSNGCTTTSSVSITEPAPILFNATITDETSPGASNGAITVNITSGIPVSFLWSNGASTQHLTGLGAGVYTLTVTDLTNGCSDILTFEVGVGMSATGEIPGLVGYTLAPNPAAGQSTLTLFLERALPVGLQLTDLTGRVIYSYPTVETAELKQHIDLSGLVPGVYVLIVSADGQRKCLTLVVGD
ncbi:MAG: hypothetical protein RL013_2854 [Bacteroidota bacterium]|jgi:hypothetical protein